MKKYIIGILALSMWGMQTTPIHATMSTEMSIEDEVRMDVDIHEEAGESTVEGNAIEKEITEEGSKEEGVVEEVIEAPTQEHIEEAIIDLSGKLLLTLGDPNALIDGLPYVLDVAPAIREGQTCVELRFIAEQLVKANTSWDQSTKQTTLTKGDTAIIITPSSKLAVVNGETLEMPGEVKVEAGRTLVPLRFLSEQFGIVVDYRKDGTILLTLPEEVVEVNTTPVADFVFEQSVYTAGQAIAVRDTSYDGDGDAIVAKEWMLNNDPLQKATSLNALFKKAKPGLYTISLKVKDSKGAWSEWTSQIVEILPNEKPFVEAITLSQSEYAQGEKITFEFTYHNESWEKIVSERWSYRALHEAENKKIAKQPDRIFKEGEYLVTLQLQDEYGNLSDVAEKIVKITDEVQMTEMAYKFGEGKPGTIMDNFDRINYRDFTDESNAAITKNNEMLVMSDSPEYVTNVGILYEETIKDSGRIMVHHVNGFSKEENSLLKKHVVVAVENTNAEPVTLTLKNKVVKGPTTDQLYIGQQLLIDYFRGKPLETYVIQPGEMIYIYESRQIRWDSEECISGLMDFETSAPLKLRVAAIHTTTELEELKEMPYLAKDMHPRGTFYTTQITHNVQIESQIPTKLTLGDRSSNVEEGIDAITGEIVLNTGNYGISYLVRVTGGQEDVAIVLNPRGGLFRGAIKWDNGESYLLPEVGFLPGYERGALIGIVKAGETKTFEYMLPNGSAAPVILGFIPQSVWSN